jgi:alkaline phosphatase D
MMTTAKPSSTNPGNSRKSLGTALALVLLAAVFLLGQRIYDERSRGDPELRSALASIKVAAMPPAEASLEIIAVGSCLHQSRPQPILKDVIAARPQLMLMIGDNVYGDVKGPEARELSAAYTTQARHAAFAQARAAVPMLATWDDHDYGSNDGGEEFAHKSAAARLFHQFWGMSPERPVAEGVHYSRIFGPPGRRVQIIMLDTRTFRSPLRPKSAEFTSWGKFEPDMDAGKTMLGASQWTWLERELRRPADVRLVVSSVQVLADGHGWERWGNMPRQRERLLSLLERTEGGIVLLSGDRHAGALYRKQQGSREIVEMTSSSLNMPPPGPNRDDRVAPLASDIYTAVNFGVLGIDWKQRSIQLSLRGIGGATLVGQSLQF